MSSFELAVIIFPPADRQARTMFKLLMMTELEKALTRTSAPPSSGSGSSSGTKRVAWSDRGWRRRDDFHQEMEKALSDGESSLSGVIIAREQTLQEAEALVAQLAANSAQVGIELERKFRTRVLIIQHTIMFLFLCTFILLINY